MLIQRFKLTVSATACSCKPKGSQMLLEFARKTIIKMYVCSSNEKPQKEFASVSIGVCIPQRRSPSPSQSVSF